MIPARKSKLLDTLFFQYTCHYMRRSFHAIHLTGDLPHLDKSASRPLLICLNHSSWWDLLMAIYLGRAYFDIDNYGLMDQRQLERYRFFSKLGIYGVDRTSLSGAKEFLRYSEELLKGKHRALWLTPQGDFVSTRSRPIQFQPGVSHLANRLEEFDWMTVALHYEFWNERSPEAFVSLSPVTTVQISEDGLDRKALLHKMELQLEHQLDNLLVTSETRDPSKFRQLLRGESSISPTYDFIRKLGARLRGESFSAEHGEIVTPQWRSGRHTR